MSPSMSLSARRSYWRHGCAHGAWLVIQVTDRQTISWRRLAIADLIADLNSITIGEEALNDRGGRFRPRLGRLRARGSPRGRRYLQHVLRAVARAGGSFQQGPQVAIVASAALASAAEPRSAMR